MTYVPPQLRSQRRFVRDFAAHEVVRVLTGQRPVSPVNADQLARLKH
jgi:hypothetical protein